MSTTPGYAWPRSFDALGKPDRAQELRAKAAALFERFNEAFWDEELGFYAYALDGDKNKVLRSHPMPGIAYGPASCRRARQEGRGAADGARHVDAAGASARCPPITGHSIHTIIRRARSGRTTTPSSPWVSNSMASVTEAARIAHDISVAASHFRLTSAAGALHRVASATRQTFPVQYIGANVPAGLGGRLGLHADPGPVGIPTGCAAQ